MTTTRDRERLDATDDARYITGQILGVDGESFLHA
jgi:hypothetical protein